MARGVGIYEQVWLKAVNIYSSQLVSEFNINLRMVQITCLVDEHGSQCCVRIALA